MAVWEIALAALGGYLLVTGRLNVLGRQVSAARARVIGLILLAPLMLALLLAAALSETARAETFSSRTGSLLTLIEMALVAAAIGGALLVFKHEKRAGGLFWRGAAPDPPRADPLPPAGAGQMSVAQAARALGVSKLEVLILIRTGTLPGVRAGWTYHIDKRAVDKLRLLRREP